MVVGCVVVVVGVCGGGGGMVVVGVCGGGRGPQVTQLGASHTSPLWFLRSTSLQGRAHPSLYI